MRIYFILYIINLIIIFVYSVQFNHQCTFSYGTCNWHIGRRWQVKNIDDETDDQVLVAMNRNNQDKEMGFTDIITSSWLYLPSSSCSDDIRLTFQFSIENEQDQIEAFIIKKNTLEIFSIGQWKALTNNNSSDDIESLWQQANMTFRATEQFRIEIEIRHLPAKKIDSTTWFAIDDILMENCPYLQTTTPILTEPITVPSYINIRNTSYHLYWKYNNNNTYAEFSTPQLTLLTFILYTLCTFIALTLFIIFLAVIISIYRKYCLPSSISSTPIIRSSRRKYPSRIDQDTRTEKTVFTTVRLHR